MRLLAILMALAFTLPAAAQTQAEMTAQAGDAYRRADAAMASAWRVAHAAMKARDVQNRSRGGFGYAAALLESQRAWLKFRDAQCRIEGAEFAGGSMQAMATAQCLTRLTNERTAQLRAFRWAR